MAADRHRIRRRRELRARGAVACLAAGLLTVAAVFAQQPAGADGDTPSLPSEGAAADRRLDDPYRAYESGRFDRALEGFSNEQVARPDDPVVQLNLGSTYYKLDDYEAAQREYARAARAEEEALRAEALYNLGNAAYRQGRLEEAIESYRSALDLSPDDLDAKYNLEFVQRELERQQQQQQDQQQQDQQDQQQDQQQQDQQQQDQQQGSQDQQEGESPNESAREPADSDQDGLPDQVERRGRNPTDPENPDSDGDGRLDGEEDRNANGEVDEGESDPNVPDQPPEAQGEPQPSEQAPTGDPTEMSAEEAQRFLEGLEEERPDAKPVKGRVKRLEKDW